MWAKRTTSGGDRSTDRGILGGLVAIALLAVAVLGVLRFELAHGGGSSFRVTFPIADVAGASADATLAEGQSASKTIDIATRNVTRVEFRLTWTDDIGDPDTFQLTATDPKGVARNVEGSNGSLSVAFEGIASVPSDARMLAASEQEAAQRVAESGMSSAAVGAWRVDVKLVSAPGTRVGGIEVQKDGANAWALTSVISFYRAAIVHG